MTCSQNNNEHKNVKNPSKEAGWGGTMEEALRVNR